MSSFSTNKRPLLVCLHLSTTWQLFMCLHPVMNEWQLTYFCSLKIHHVLAFFGSFFLSTNHGCRFAPLLTHTWLIRSEVLPCPYLLVMIERVGERLSLPLVILLTTIVRWFLLATIVHWRPNVLGFHISSSQYVHAHINIHIHYCICVHPGIEDFKVLQWC